MDFLPSEDQLAIVDACRSFLVSELPLSRLHQRSGAMPNDRQLWPAMGDLGWFGIGIAAQEGGAGLTLMEELLICIETGRHLVSPSFISSLLAAHLGEILGRKDWLAPIVRGESAIALALPVGAIELNANAIGGKFFALEAGGSAALLLVTPSAVALIEKPGAGEVIPGMDASVAISQFEFSGVIPTLYFEGCALHQRALLLSAAQALGAAQQVLALSVEYAGLREQFGRPIGSFQALKHRCAEMALRNEAALSQLVQAGLEAMGQLPGAAFDVAAAKLLADDAATKNAADSVHIHGAMGFTTELPIHFFLKRAHLLSQLFSPRRDLLADLAALPTPA